MGFNGKKIPQLNKAEAEKILEEIIMESHMDLNTIPMDQLESYSIYRSERLLVQKGVAVIAMLILLILPAWFIMPRFTVEEHARGIRNLPVYEVHVSGLLPIQSVTAVLKGYSMPVYQADARTFTIEPTKNGTMQVEVTLFNKQLLLKEVQVSSVDADKPVMLDSYVEGELLHLQVADADSGINYKAVYAVDLDGNQYTPSLYDESDGIIEFLNIKEGVEIVIPDNIGNELKLHITVAE